MPFSLIPFLLLIVPIVEIAVFVVVGGKIGVLYTIVLILLTAVMGSILLRIQGFQVLSKLQEETRAGRMPGRQIVDGVMIMAAGILLLTPGFVTDSLGFLLFVPAIRNLVWAFVASRISVVAARHFTERDNQRRDAQWHRQHPEEPEPGTSPIIDLDEDEYFSGPDPQSPWNKHEKK